MYGLACFCLILHYTLTYSIWVCTIIIYILLNNETDEFKRTSSTEILIQDVRNLVTEETLQNMTFFTGSR